MSSIFTKRLEKLDWQLIAEIEPLVVVMEAPEELEKIQKILPSIAHCNMEAEFGKENLENTRGLAKLFRLSQISLQYQLHMIEDLKHKAEEREQEREEFVQKLLNTEERFACLEKETLSLRKEVKKSRKMLAVQQESLFKGTDFKEFQKCLLCPKTFINESFLLSHMNRRHKTEMRENGLSPSVFSEMMKDTNNVSTTTATNNDELRMILQEIRKEVLTNNRGDGNELQTMSCLITNQQKQINELQNLLKSDKNGSNTNEKIKEEYEGRLKAQELFWGKRMREIESNFKCLLDESDKKHEKLQEDLLLEVTQFKKKLTKERRREKKRQHKAEVVKETENIEARSQSSENKIEDKEDEVHKNVQVILKSQEEEEEEEEEEKRRKEKKREKREKRRRKEEEKRRKEILSSLFFSFLLFSFLLFSSLFFSFLHISSHFF